MVWAWPGQMFLLQLFLLQFAVKADMIGGGRKDGPVFGALDCPNSRKCFCVGKDGEHMEASVEKHKIDMLHGPIWSKIPRFALPVAATAILEQLFNASDVAVVGNFTAVEQRTAAVAAVGANGPITSLVINLFIGVALGANVVIANAIGRDDREAVQRAVHTAIVLALLGGVLIAILGEAVAGWLLGLLQSPADVFPLALLYLRIYLVGMPVILLYNFEAAIFRSVGETKTPLVALAASGVINVLLNLFFVAVLHMTVNGVAIATVISNGISAVILFRKLLHSDKYIRVEPKKMRIDGASLRQILKIGLPAGIQSSVFSVSNIVIQSAINSLGTVVMAASSAAYNIEIFTYDILNSFGQACTTFTGQNFGAGQPRRCRRTLFLCMGEGVAVLGATVVLLMTFARPLLSIFNPDPAVVDIGYIRLQLILVAHLCSLFYEITSGYLRGFGISLVPAVLTILGVCGFRIVWIETVFPLYPTFRTIMMVYPISLSSTAVMMLVAALIYHPSRKLLQKQQAAEEVVD